MRYVLSMIDAAPNGKTIAELVATPCQERYIPLRDVDYRRFGDIIAAIAKKGALEDVIFKKVYDEEKSIAPAPLFAFLSILKQKDILQTAQPKTREKIFSNEDMIFGGVDTLKRLLELAPNNETKLQILSATKSDGKNLLYYENLAPICLDELEELKLDMLDYADTKEEKDAICAKFNGILKGLLLQQTNFGFFAISNPQYKRNLVLRLLDSSPDEETFNEQLKNIYYSDSVFSNVKPGDVIDKISTQEQLNIFLNSQVHERCYTCPVMGCLDLGETLRVLDKFDTAKAKLDFLLGSYSCNMANRKTGFISENILKKLNSWYTEPERKKNSISYWNKILEIVQGDDVSALDAIKLLKRYSFIVPDSERKYYTRIIDTLNIQTQKQE